MVMGFLSGLISFSSFLTGTVFGVLICVAAALHFLKKSNEGSKSSKDHRKYKETLATPNQPKSIKEILKPEDDEEFKRLIKFLEDFNAPLKSIGGYLQQIYSQRENGIQTTKDLLDRKAKVIIEVNTINRMEKELHDNLSNLKEHGKVMKGISSFLSDLSKACASFSKDLNRLSNTAKNNMYKGLKDLNIDTKEDLIINNWWQALHVSLDYMASDQDYLSSQISEDILNLSTQIHDELSVIEKRLNTEGNKQVHNIKENLSLYESKRKERDKYKEKVRVQGNSATLSTQSPAEIAQRRALKMKINDDHLTIQTSKLYTAQKEFFTLMPRIDADIQLTVLKSIVETHSQLLKLTESFERQQESNKMISKRMRLQLTNAAASLMQMIREEGNLLAPSTAMAAAAEAGMGTLQYSAAVIAEHPVISSGGKEPEIVAYEEALRAKMLESGVQGYELSLQKVLEGLLQHCQTFDFTYGLPTTTAGVGGIVGGAAVGSAVDTADSESRGELNMAKESTACLAAANPAILPLLPSRFGTAVGAETCVWFNSFSGRVYRDISHSNYFYNWFCRKLTIMLNKGARPDYIDEFKVNDVQFGVLPPMLLNVKWSPPCKPGPFSFGGGEGEPQTRKRGKSPEGPGHTTSSSSSGTSGSATSGGNRAFIYDESESSDSERESFDDEVPRKATVGLTSSSTSSSAAGTGPRQRKHKNPPPKTDDSEYFAACTADMAFRSGIKFTISTKLWINWPRDRYASVPVTLHLDLAELSGKIRFGVTRGHSFFSFLGDPLMRINVRNEVGKGAYKFKDFPQLSEFIVKKLKAYVHNKIVHPHSHKFRLIWPRNWWPEGTQGEFGGDGEEVAAQHFDTPAAVVVPPVPTPVSTVPVAVPSTAHSAASLGPHVITSASSTPVPVPMPTPASVPTQQTQEVLSSSRQPTAEPSTPEGYPSATSFEPLRDIAAATASGSHESSGSGIATRDRANSRASGIVKIGSGLRSDEALRAHNASTTNLRTAGITSDSLSANTAHSHSSPAVITTAGASAATGVHAATTVTTTSSSTTTTTSSSSSVTYQAVKSKVTQWMQNRRNSTADAEDHYHPLSRATTQSAQAPQQPVLAGQEGQEQDRPRRLSGSEKMKALMDSARQSTLFRSSFTAPPATSISVVADTKKDVVEQATDEQHETMFNHMALLPLSSLHQEVVNDNLAWELEVRNLINRYVEKRRPRAGSGSLPGTPLPVAGAGAGFIDVRSGSPDAQLEVDADLESIRPVSYRAAQRCLTRRFSNARNPIEATPAAYSTNSSAAALLSTIINVSPQRRGSRACSITSSGAGHDPWSLEHSEHHGARRASRDSDDPSLNTGSVGDNWGGSGRPRSFSISDFRSEILEVAFKIHVICSPKRSTVDLMNKGTESSTSGGGCTYRIRPCIYPADPYRSVDDTSFGYSTERPLQFAQPSSLEQYTRTLQQQQLQQQLSQPHKAGAGGSNPLHGVDIAAKFAEFKSRHLKNRDIATVFMRKTPQRDGASVSAASSDTGTGGSRNGRAEGTGTVAVEVDKDDVAAMREALIHAEDDSADMDDSSHGASNFGHRASFSGPPGGGSGALKYMSNMIRSQFHKDTPAASAGASDAPTAPAQLKK